MRVAFICAAVISGLSISSIAMAQPAPMAASVAPTLKLEEGVVVHSSEGSWVGPINYVEKAKDGSPVYVAIIRDGRMVHITVDTLSTGPKGLTTSLSIKEIDQLP
jgi:hypothetical protein